MKPLLATCCAATILVAALFGSTRVNTLPPTQLVLAQAGSATQVAAIARQVTVQIDGQAPGSGVIIARQGQTYYVLTAAHVVATEDEYAIITPDGKKQPLDYKQVRKFPDVDLAIVQFNSPQTYQVATIGSSNQLKLETSIYVAGFPKARGDGVGTSYQFSDGELAALATRPISQGYALAYINDTFTGMSGGPIFNQKGELIGIHGASKTLYVEDQGVDSRTGVKEGLNLGMPIDTFLRLLPQINTSLKLPVAPPLAVSTQLTASDFLVQAVERYLANDTQAALAAIEQAIRIQPNYATAYFIRGNFYSKVGNIQAMLANYDQAIRVNPNFARAYMNRGFVRANAQDFKGAIADADQAIRINPNLAYAYSNRGFARMGLQDFQGAIADFTQAIRLNPTFSAAYLNRGGARLDIQDYQGALADYTQAIRLNPKDSTAYNNRGLVRAALGDGQGAIADYDQAIRLNSNNAEAYGNRGLARAKLGDRQGAIADYDQVIRLKPSFALAYNNRGNARALLRDFQGARADFQKAAELARSQGNSRLYETALRNLQSLEQLQR